MTERRTADTDKDMTIQIPPLLHDVFGEKQTLGELLVIILTGVGVATVLFIAVPEMTQGLPLWQTSLAYLLTLDIAAGCVANFTRSTNNHYAARSRERLVFIAVHVHILLLAGLLGIELWPAILVWAYTIVGTLVVNTLKGNRFQMFVAGTLLALGVMLTVLGTAVPKYFLVIALLFMLKVLFSFAVDHYGEV